MTEPHEPYNIDQLVEGLDGEGQANPCPRCGATAHDRTEITESGFEGHTIVVMRCQCCGHVWAKVIAEGGAG